jgi:hypothetical protein
MAGGESRRPVCNEKFPAALFGIEFTIALNKRGLSRIRTENFRRFPASQISFL